MITIAYDGQNRRVHIDETAPGHEYFCPVCGEALVTKRGEIRRHHYAHRPGCSCADSWGASYSDSEWHFEWMERYPKQNREHTLTLGRRRHRADVIAGKTVVEFQQSALAPDAFVRRNDFYAELGYKVIWLYDLREPFASGAISQMGETGAADDASADSPAPAPATPAGPIEFRWQNPRKNFNTYEIETGPADLFFQLRDDDGGACIVQVRSRGKQGFGEFSAQRWMTAERFLEFTGVRDGVCPEPCLTPLEPGEDYLRFRERFSVELNPQQERAAQVVDGAALLLAVPGSGKTTVMVSRLAYLVFERHVPPEQVVAITYTKVAAREMRDRFAQRFGDRATAERIRFCTINSLANGIYEDWRKSRSRRVRRLISSRESKRLLRDIYREVTQEFGTAAAITDLETRISWAKNTLIDDEAILAYDDAPPEFAKMYELYSDYLRRRSLMDFDDQMRFAKYVLERDAPLLEKYRTQYQYWCVDEAQDTSPLQYRIVELLSAGAASVFMVGDEDQSIYGYRGACPEELFDFKFAYDNAVVLKMELNYRSGSEIVEVANDFVNRNENRFEKRMVSHRGPGSKVCVQEVRTRMDQYDAALAIVREHDAAVRSVREYDGAGAPRSGAPAASAPATLGVIYRDNESGILLIDRLMRAGVAFQLLSKSNTFFSSAVVRDITSFLMLALDPYDTTSFRQIYAKAGCYIRASDADYVCRDVRRGRYSVCQALLAEMSTYRKSARAKRRGAQNARRFSRLLDEVASLSPADAIRKIVDGGYGDWLDDHDGVAYRVDMLEDLAEREDDVRSFLARLERLDKVMAGDDSHRRAAPVVLSTAHSCKGREFDRVLIIDAVKGTFPSTRTDSMARSAGDTTGYQEERRLFYVAMTRARDELILLRPTPEPTPFVDECRKRVTPL